jgi:hypothetical protein
MFFNCHAPHVKPVEIKKPWAAEAAHGFRKSQYDYYLSKGRPHLLFCSSATSTRKWNSICPCESFFVSGMFE